MLKSHLHHFIFGLTILALASLLTWWTVFIHNSIDAQKNSHLEKLRYEMETILTELREDVRNPPKPGLLTRDDRFEIVECSHIGQRLVQRLEPHWTDLCIQPRSVTLNQIENKYARQNFMLVGEAIFFVLIILVSSFFLYRFIQLERRTALEVKRFWERSAHEIKTPVTGIKAFLQNLKSHAYNVDELEPYVELALKQVANQEQLANNIVSGYHLKSTNVPAKMTDFLLNTFLTEYFEKSSLHFTNAQILLEFQTGRNIHVRANPANLKVILDNIVDNAIKYCTIDLVMTVDIRREKKRAIVSITDNGPGMSPEKLKNVLSAFKHLDDELPVKRCGAGFGMYIASQLAHNMGGNLRISSEGIGRGSQFLIFLNLAKKIEL